MFGGELRQCFCLLQQLLNGLSFEGGSVNFFHRASLPYLSDLGVQFMGSSIDDTRLFMDWRRTLSHVGDRLSERLE